MEAEDSGIESATDKCRQHVRGCATTSMFLAVVSFPLVWLPMSAVALLLLERLSPGLGQDRILIACVGTGFAVSILASTAVIAGIISLAKGKRLSGSDRVRWRPLIGISLGVLNVALISLMAHSMFNRFRDNNDMALCANNLKKLELALRAYEAKHQGQFPPLSTKSGVLMFSAEAMLPSDDLLNALNCPTLRGMKTGSAAYEAAHTQPPPCDDQSYFYLGYALRNEDAVEAFAKAYRNQIAAGGTFDDDLVLEESDGKHVLHRLRQGVKEVLSNEHDRLSASPYEGRQPEYQVPTAVCDDVPLLIERDCGHADHDWDGSPRGAHVLFLNAGLQFVARGTWPITEKTQRILSGLAE